MSGTALPTFDSSNPNDPAVGMTIPTVTGKSFDGTPVTIQPTGTPQMLMFVAHWCPHCQREVPLVSDWMKKGGLPAGVQLTTVATGTSSDAPNYPPSAWLEKNDWPSPIMADSANSDAANAFGLASYPYFVFVDGNGKVVGRTSGEISTDQLADGARAARRPGERVAPSREGAASSRDGFALHRRRARRGCRARIGPRAARLDDPADGAHVEPAPKQVSPAFQ